MKLARVEKPFQNYKVGDIDVFTDRYAKEHHKNITILKTIQEMQDVVRHK